MDRQYDSQGARNKAELINNDSFERMRRRKKSRAFGEWVRIIFVALLLSAVLFLVCAFLFFRAENVSVEGNSLYTEEEILRVSGIGSNDNIYLIKPKDLQQRISLYYPYVKAVALKRVPPSTLVITVQEDSPGYYTELEGEYFMLSESLRVLAHTENEKEYTDLGLKKVLFPSVTYAIVGRQLGFVRESTFEYMRGFLSTLKASEFADGIVRVDATEKYGIRVILEDGRIKAVFGGADNMDEKLRFLSNIKKQVLGENETAALVDVSNVKAAYVSFKTEPFE